MVKSAALIVIDGWGVSSSTRGNAIKNASVPVMDELTKTAAYAELNASGLAVGLPDGLMGNSEVGHLNVGCGRIVYQDIIRIELGIKEGYS
jgi:2,3-bisphosphoglycerate-independent phosphoglycerate mutase